MSNFDLFYYSKQRNYLQRITIVLESDGDDFADDIQPQNTNFLFPGKTLTSVFFLIS